MNIKPIYEQIWELARPYYEKGRPMDIDHIEWFMGVATEIAEKEGLDDTILLPLAILHDVGYSKVKDVATANYYDGDIRALHMAEGAKIAAEILKEVGYDQEKSKKIVHYVSIHDNWGLKEKSGGDKAVYLDIYLNDPILGTFKDLDYIWIYTEKGCKGIQPVLKLDDSGMLAHLQSEKSPMYGEKPFSNPSTQKLHDDLLKEREAEFATKYNT